MIKQAVMLEVEKEDRKYQFHLPPNGNLGEIHDVLFQMRSYIIEKIQEAQRIDAPKLPEVPQPALEVKE